LALHICNVAQQSICCPLKQQKYSGDGDLKNELAREHPVNPPLSSLPDANIGDLVLALALLLLSIAMLSPERTWVNPHKKQMK
jgi:hypothetical protein